MTDTEKKTGPDIDWVKTLAGALAAMTSAVLLSTLGAVGTLVGAALGSVAATVGTALYAQGLARSRRVVVRAQEQALDRIGVAEHAVRRARTGGASRRDLDRAVDELADARADLEESVDAPDEQPDDEPAGVGARLRALPWKRVAVLAGAMFAVAMVAILAFELLAGRSVSSYTGGTDGDRRTTIFGGEPAEESDHERDRPPPGEPTGEQSEAPPTEPSAPDPTEVPTEEPTPTPSPSDEPTDQPTTAPPSTTPPG